MSVFTKENLKQKLNLHFTDEQVLNINKLYEYLKNTLKWSNRNIAAAMGNAMLESSFRYGQVSSAGAVGAFQFLGDRLKDYNSWRQKNGYRDGALSQATYLDHIIKKRIDPRLDTYNNALALLENKNHIDSINANQVLSYMLPLMDKGTFYPVKDLTDAWESEDSDLDTVTSLWMHTIERPGKSEASLDKRLLYANGFYSLLPLNKYGGIMNYLNYIK